MPHSDERVFSAVSNVRSRLCAVIPMGRERRDGVTLHAARGFSGTLDPRPVPAVPALSTRAGFLATLKIALVTPTGRLIRARHAGVSVALVMAGAGIEAATADNNGRNIMTSNATFARRLRAQGHRCSTDTAAKVRYVLRDLGFETTTDEGRHLTKTERLEILLTSGVKRIRKSSTRSLTMPREYAGLCDPLRSSDVNKKTSLRCGYQAGAKARPGQAKKSCKDQTHSPANISHRPKAQKTAQDGPAWSAGMWKLASAMEAALANRAGSQGKDKRPHLGQYCRILDDAGITATMFTPRALTELTNKVLAMNGQRGWYSPEKVASPLGYLRWVLNRATSSGLVRDHVALQAKELASVAERRQSAVEAQSRAMADLAGAAAQRTTNARGARLAKESLAKRRLEHGNTETRKDVNT